MADTKYRFWAFLVYPESAPDNWVRMLKSTHGMYAISPLHHPDDETKKSHHHVVYCHGAPTTLAAARAAIPSAVPANGYIEPAASPVGYCRYLVHLDDPEKQQWKGNPRDFIEVLNGFPLQLHRDMTREEVSIMRDEILNFCRAYNVTEYSELAFWCLENNRDWLDYVETHTIFLQGVIGSFRWKKQKESDEQEDADDE